MKKSANQKQMLPVKKLWLNLLMVSTMLLVGLLAIPSMVYAQNKTITGKVTNESGAAVVGATVQVKGNTGGTTTDNNGNFSIEAAKGATIVISNVGFTSREIAVGDDAQINIQLQISSRDINEVIVVGYGTQKKRNVTGAISSVNLETMANAPNTNIGQYLQGTVPGLNVGLSTFAGGTPPINIRGRVTISGNQSAVIIVDGIQYSSSLSSINPDDIASIDILKDASATAVYGAQGANGVILITTKKGKFNQKPRISFSTAFTSQKPSVGDDLKPNNRQQYLDGVRDAFWQEAYIGPDFTQLNSAFDVRSKLDPTARPGYDNGRDFDWYEGATNKGAIVENNLSVSGGGDRVTYLLSGGFVNQKGWIINDKFNRKNLRANLEIKALDWWKVGLQAYGSFVNQDGAEPGFGGINIFSPLYSPYDSLGNVIPSPTNTVLGNPMTSYFVDDRDRHQYYTGVVYTDIDIPGIKGLNYRMNFGQNLRNDQHYYASKFDANQNGRAYKENQSLYDYTFDNILTYKTKFKQHGLEVTALYGAIERKYERTFAEGTVFSRLNLSYNNIGGADQRSITTNAYSEALNYQMGKLNYSYADKYLLQAIVRRDGFSGFAENFKYGVFPSVSAGWIISSEDFMQNVKWVNNLKLRAGYGVIGNQTQRYFSIASVGTNTSYVFGDNATVLFGQQVNALGNPNLKWERTKGLDIGIDFAIFDNRLTGNFDYYNNTTRDLLFNVQIPDVTGFTQFRTNLGEINNKGWEIGLTGNIIRNRNLNWTSSFNIWRNTNKIVHLTGVDANGDGIEDDIVASNLFIGRPVGANTIFNYRADHIYQVGETPLPGFFVGSMGVVDQDKSGTITAVDRVFIGSKLPAYSMSLYNSVSYKEITFSFMLNSVQGGKNGYLENNARQYFRDDNGIRNNELRGVKFWTPANPGAKYPRITGGTRPLIDNPPLYESRSFVRLQDVSLSYSLPKNILDKIKAQAISFYISGKNLITWTKWDGWDPEALVPIFANGVTTDEPNGMRTDGRPVLRAITIGAHITF